MPQCRPMLVKRWPLHLTLSFAIASAAYGADARPENFIYSSADDVESVKPLLARYDIAGLQVVYTWKLLEASKDRYNFSPIERDLALTKSLRKKLFIQIQDRFFSPNAKNVPAYLLTDPVYRGGIVSQMDHPGENRTQVSGWVAEQWNPPVQRRYQKLLEALAHSFDGQVYGVNLPETAMDIDVRHDKTGFTCEKYFQAELENIAFARRAFSKSHVVQYVNFWPCEWSNDHDYMGRVFAFAARNHVGLGGPDIVPYQRAQMHNSYPFLSKYKGKLSLVAMAVQEPTLTYRNPRTGKRFTKEEFIAFATSYLGAHVIFWSASTPWLRKRIPVSNPVR